MTVEGTRERLRTGLREAMRARDTTAVAALRSALAAIDNAEAITVADPRALAADGEYVAGAALGVGATEATRRSLTEADVVRLLQAEAGERRAAARDYLAARQPGAAERLEAEAAVLERYL